MSEIEARIHAKDSNEKSTEGISWSEYATSYDEFVVPLSCYQDNIKLLQKFLVAKSTNLNEPHICDIGAGTGIYIKSMAEICADANFTHLDLDAEMCAYAQRRYSDAGLGVKVLNQSADSADIDYNSQDIVTAVNVIYALPKPKQRLKDIYDWLRPGGYFFVIDFGRRQNSLDWTQYFFRELLKRRGLVASARAIPSAINLFRRQNEGVEAQDSGAYWLHTTEDFVEELEKVGFEVEESSQCYRGYADMAICRKPV